MNRISYLFTVSLVFFTGMLIHESPALAAGAASEASPTASPGEPSPEGEEVDVSKVTQKYWAQGKDTELGVVQNRKYTSAHRFEFDVFAGTISTDPFLNVQSFGGSIGYYFNEYSSLHAFYWKDFVSTSSAYTDLKAGSPTTNVDTNYPIAFYGAEFDQNILYGKASLFGNAIIYVDVYLLGGGGVNVTSTGNDATAFVGLGQKIHLNKHMAIDLNYRVMFFSENVVGDVTGDSHSRSNTTDAINLGLCFFY